MLQELLKNNKNVSIKDGKFGKREVLGNKSYNNCLFPFTPLAVKNILHEKKLFFFVVLLEKYSTYDGEVFKVSLEKNTGGIGLKLSLIHI